MADMHKHGVTERYGRLRIFQDFDVVATFPAKLLPCCVETRSVSVSPNPAIVYGHRFAKMPLLRSRFGQPTINQISLVQLSKLASTITRCSRAARPSPEALGERCRPPLLPACRRARTHRADAPTMRRCGWGLHAGRYGPGAIETIIAPPWCGRCDLCCRIA